MKFLTLIHTVLKQLLLHFWIFLSIVLAFSIFSQTNYLIFVFIITILWPLYHPLQMSIHSANKYTSVIFFSTLYETSFVNVSKSFIWTPSLPALYFTFCVFLSFITSQLLMQKIPLRYTLWGSQLEVCQGHLHYKICISLT